MAKDEGDHCTLSPASVVDAVDLSRDGVLNLYAVEEPHESRKGEVLGFVCVRIKCPKVLLFLLFLYCGCFFILFQYTPSHVSWNRFFHCWRPFSSFWYARKGKAFHNPQRAGAKSRSRSRSFTGCLDKNDELKGHLFSGLKHRSRESLLARATWCLNMFELSTQEVVLGTRSIFGMAQACSHTHTSGKASHVDVNVTMCHPYQVST